MDIKKINSEITVSEQLTLENLDQLAELDTKSIICNRPDDEAEQQQNFPELEKRARDLGIEIHYLPVVHDKITAKDVEDFEAAFVSTPKPVHAYCRTGLRAVTLWSLMQIKHGQNIDAAISTAQVAGYDFSDFKSKFSHVIKKITSEPSRVGETHSYEVVIVGAGAAGISVASSLLSRKGDLRIAIIDPAEVHYYQPGFTFIGGGIFTPELTRRSMDSLVPRKVSWIKAAVTEFEPDGSYVVLDNGAHVTYDRLVVCPGLKLDWNAVEGLAESLGANGVTSNYHPDYAAYTWSLVQQLKSGKALFTQPPMPIKCAGAPQKAMYLSADFWQKTGVLDNIDVAFYNAGGVLFGVKEYVPALESYIQRYDIALNLSHNLVKVDGPGRKATFARKDGDGNTDRVEADFDMLHVCPPQCAPDFVRQSKLADDAGWVDVNPYSLRHKHHENIWALGDVCNAPNAKTAAAVRKQAPIVAANLVNDIEGKAVEYAYDGYGSCPLTVERGKIVLAEFGYNGKLLPTFPKWIIDGTRPSHMAWLLKEKALPKIYWDVMLKGHEWLVKPRTRIEEVIEES